MEEAQGGYEYEGELDSAVAPALEEYGIAVFRELGEPPDLINISPQVWETASQILIVAIAPILAKVFRNIAIRALGDDVDLSLIDQTAADWARQYTFALVKDINLTTIQALQRIISGFFEKPTTMGELQAQILKIIGSPARANAIAVTEVTRAVSEAEQAAAKELEKRGIILDPYWQTNKDELVCPICRPRDGKKITDGEFPPAHVRCRCRVRYEIRNEGNRGNNNNQNSRS